MPKFSETAINAAKTLFGGLFSSISADDNGGAAWRAVQDTIDKTASYREDIQKLRDFFDGEQIIGTGLNNGDYYIPSWPDESDDDLETRAERMQHLAWNRIRDGVLTHVDGLYAHGRGRAVGRHIDWTRADDVDQSTQDWFDAYYRDRFLVRNSFPVVAWNTWATVGAEGWALNMLRWMDGGKRRLRYFQPGLPRAAHKDHGVVSVELIDNLHSIPLPHPDEPTELGAVIRWYLDPDAQYAALAGDTPSPGNRDTITELVTDTLWVRWLGTEPKPHSWGFVNRYGDVRTLFVWAKNPLLIADSLDALPAQTLLNEHLYTGQEIKRNHAFPETLYRGYEPPTRTDSDGNKVLVRSMNTAHVAEDPNADIIKRTPDTSVQDVGIALSDVHQMLNDAMSLSQPDRGDGSGLGQARSAPAISRMQARSERRRQRKLLFAEAWEQSVFRSVMDMTAYHALGMTEPEVLRKLFPARLTVTYPDDAFVMDPFTAAQKDQIEVQAGVATLEENIRKRHPEATDEEIAAMVKEAQQQRQPVGGAGRDPDPTPQGKSQAQGSM